MDNVGSTVRGRIGQLDSLRGFAVLLVILHHSVQAFRGDTADATSGVSSVLDLGRMGVVIFFMISGFVIARAVPGSDMRAARRFWKHRFFRLYPPFWASLLLAGATAALVGASTCCAFSVPVTPIAMLANATMFPLRFYQPALQGVYWTLELELLFYLLVTAFALRGRSDYRAMATMALLLFGAAIVAAGLRVMHHGASEVGKDQLFIALLHLSLMFAGAACRFTWDSLPDPRAFLTRMPRLLRLYFASLTIFFAGVVAIKLRHGADPQTFRVAATYLLAIAAFLVCLRFFRGSRPGLFVGNRSYGLYLVHLPMFTLVSLLIAQTSWFRPDFVTYLLIVLALSFGAADLLRRFVERPAIRFAHGRERLARPRAGALPAAEASS